MSQTIQFKKGEKANLPAHALVAEPLFASDTYLLSQKTPLYVEKNSTFCIFSYI